MKQRLIAVLAGVLAIATATARASAPFVVATPSTSTSARGEPFANPVVPGFSPDPSIVRVGDDFYLVCSSFEYFPGVPLYHSRDLVNWELINHCLSRPSQLPLGNCPASSGLFSPTLRHRDGVFYLIASNLASGGVFFVTTRDPRGEWSEPVWLGNFNPDPSLMFDEDGRSYIVHSHGGKQGRIFLMEVNVADCRYCEGWKLPGRFLWTGTGGEYPQGPRLFKNGSHYYLTLAEGGGSGGHRQTIARADTPEGPYWPYENNPILSHRDRSDDPIMATGRVDFVQLQDGSWWSVFFGVRQNRRQSHLGRETFLAPVEWTKDGWPLVGGDRRVALRAPGPALQRAPQPQPPVRDDFSATRPGPEWLFVRNPVDANYDLAARPGWLRLAGAAAGLDEPSSPTALLRRLRHFDTTFATRIDFSPTRDGDEAGLVLRLNESLHAEFCLHRRGGATQVLVRATSGKEKTILHSGVVAANPVEFHVQADRESFTFRYRLQDGTLQPAGTLSTRSLSPEASWALGVSCFTGLTIGVYATGNGAPAAAPADFDWFDYSPATGQKP